MARSLENTIVRVRHSSLCEPETERLQKAADTFTQQLALEKRRNLSLNDRIAHMTTQVHVKKEALKQAQADTKEQKRLQTRIEQLENQMLKERQHLNQHLLRNEYLREQVDVYRREKRAFLSTFRDFEEEEKQYKRESAEAYKSFIRVHNVDSKTAHELVRVKLKGEFELNSFETQAFSLQSAIESERKDEQIKVRKIANAMMNDLSNSKDFVDMRELLKTLYERWSSLAKQQKEEIEQHTKDIAVLQEAFGQIKEATGIAEIQEVVTSFIKSEEQNYLLYKQITALTTEADGLEEQLSSLNSTLSFLKSSSDSREKQQIEMNWESEQRLLSLRGERLKHAKQSKSLAEHIRELAGTVEELLAPAWEMGLVEEKEGREEFGEVTAEETLGVMEESINAVLTYLRKTASEDAMFITELPDKDFFWKVPGIATQVEQIVAETMEEDDHPLTEKEFNRRKIQRARKLVTRDRE